ncbi:uncharacterized protein LOC103571623 [Microplitis demolitor]|uniref:uncharacterized protein LOC103571623 n=1 Tax=Microplitis demolitor TaxID=69319 RepID=UPI0004CD5899|nr:uncharacterized protein LOC103571623 [Microplitis demolitor]
MTNLRNTMESVDRDHDGFNNYVKSITSKYAKMKKNVNEFMIDAKVYEFFDQVIKYLMSHPVLSAICLLILASFTIPIFLFVSFTIINIAFAFTGFIIVQVAVLSVGATVLCSILFCVLSIVAVIGIICVLTWSIAYYLLTFMRNIQRVR